MLDSLVRVSRRVGGAADLLVTEMPAALGQAVLAIRAGSHYPPHTGDRNPRLATTRATNFTQALVLRAAVRHVKPRRSAVVDRAARARRVLADHARTRRPDANLNLHEPTSRTPPFTTTQFHVLLNSLFKVLFNFPSRYLFAISLGVIFSLTWSLPRTLSCTPKQLDSREKPAQRVNRLTGLSPSMGRGPSQGGLWLVIALRGGSPKHHIPRNLDGWRFGAGLCPFHSPLLRASRLFSFPPLINMLKFGGSPCLLSGRKLKLFFFRHASKSRHQPRRGRTLGSVSRSDSKDLHLKESAQFKTLEAPFHLEATLESDSSESPMPLHKQSVSGRMVNRP